MSTPLKVEWGGGKTGDHHVYDATRGLWLPQSLHPHLQQLAAMDVSSGANKAVRRNATNTGFELFESVGGGGGGSLDLVDRVGVPSPAAMWDFSDADSLTLDDDMIDAAADRTQSGVNALAQSGSVRPATSEINGRQAALFAGDWLTTGTESFTGTAGEVWMVVQFTSLAALQILWSSADDASNTRFLTVYVASADRKIRIESNNASTYHAVVGSTALDPDVTYVIRIRSNGSAWAIEINGVFDTLTVEGGSNSGRWFGGVSARDNFTVGARRFNGTDQIFSDFILGELFVLEGAASLPANAQARGLRRILSQKWGATTNA